MAAAARSAAEAGPDNQTETAVGDAEIGSEIALPLLTDREPSPRGRQMSASRWASNDDASDDENEDREARRERRRKTKRRLSAATPVPGDENPRQEGRSAGSRAGASAAIVVDDDDDNGSRGSSSDQSSEVGAVTPQPGEGRGAAAAATADGAEASWNDNFSGRTQQPRTAGGLSATHVSRTRRGGDPADVKRGSTWTAGVRGVSHADLKSRLADIEEKGEGDDSVIR